MKSETFGKGFYPSPRTPFWSLLDETNADLHQDFLCITVAVYLLDSKCLSWATEMHTILASIFNCQSLHVKNYCFNTLDPTHNVLCFVSKFESTLKKLF